MTDIIKIVTAGDIMALKKLLDTQPDDAASQALLMKQNEDGMTLLHLAAAAGHLAMMQELLSRGHISLSAQDNKNRTALDVAKEKGHQAIAALLQTRMEWLEG